MIKSSLMQILKNRHHGHCCYNHRHGRIFFTWVQILTLISHIIEIFLITWHLDREPLPVQHMARIIGPMVWNWKWEKTLDRKEILQVSNPAPIELQQEGKEPGKATADTTIRPWKETVASPYQRKKWTRNRSRTNTRLLSNRLRKERFLHSLSSWLSLQRAFLILRSV